MDRKRLREVGLSDLYTYGGDGIHYYSQNAVGGKAMSITVNSQKKDVAWSFIKYLLSDEHQWEIANESSDMPVICSVAEEYKRLNFDEAQCSKFFSLLERTHYVQGRTPPSAS